MFCTPTETKTARKNHHCTYCCDPIYVGEIYKTWTSFDDSVFRSKMHPECLSELQTEYDWDDTYEPYDNERPTGFDKFSDMVKFMCYNQ